MNENHSDDQIGRARVQDTPELEAYYTELEALGARDECLEVVFDYILPELVGVTVPDAARLAE